MDRTVRVGASFAAFVAFAGCTPQDDFDSIGRAAQGVTVGNVVTFPSAGLTEPPDVTGVISLATTPDRRLVGFTRRVTSGGLVVRPYDLTWTSLGPTEGVSGATGFGVIAARASTVLAAWNSVTPARTLNVAALSPTGAVLGTPASVPAFAENIAPALGWTSQSAMLAWEGPVGAQRFVRISRVSDTGALLDGPGIQLSGALTTPNSVTLACLPTQCLVAWMDSNGVNLADTFLRRVGANAVPLDVTPMRADAPLRNRFDPAVAHDGTNYLVVWHESDASSPARGVYARRMSGSTGAWLDAAPILIRTLPSTSVEDRSSVAWNGSVWGVLTHTTTPWTFAAIGPDGRIATPARAVPMTGLTSSAQMVASRTGWEGVHLDGVYLRRFELNADGSVVRVAVPAQESVGPTQFAFGLTWAAGRFIVNAQEGLWRVTSSGVREGTAPVPLPASSTPWGPLGPSIVPAGLVASGDRVAVYGTTVTSGGNQHLYATTTDATFASFTPTVHVTNHLSGTGWYANAAPGSGFLYGLGYDRYLDGTPGGLILVRQTATGGAGYSLDLTGDSGRPTFASSGTETLVAHLVNRGAALRCTQELLLLNGTGSVLARRDVPPAVADAGACANVAFTSAASDGSSFLLVGPREALFVTGGGSITTGRRVTWTTGDAFGAVWNGSTYVIFTEQPDGSYDSTFYAQRVSPAGDVLDTAGVFVDRGITESNNRHVASDGAGRTAVLYRRYEGVNPRAVLRILDWNTSPDGGVDAGTDAARDVPIDRAVDVSPDVTIEPPRDASADAARDVLIDAGTDAARDVITDVTLDASIDAATDVDVTRDAPIDVATDVGAPLDTWTEDTPDASNDVGEDASTPTDVATTDAPTPTEDVTEDAPPSPVDDASADVPGPPRPPEDTGCACSTAGTTRRAAVSPYAFVALGAALVARRRRRSR